LSPPVFAFGSVKVKAIAFHFFCDFGPPGMMRRQMGVAVSESGRDRQWSSVRRFVDERGMLVPISAERPAGAGEMRRCQ
jgi:hypothetical protein